MPRLGKLLATIALVLALPVLVVSQSPQSGDISLNGTVPGAPPTQAAVIIQPTNGQHFTQNLITVSGTCPNDVTVEIYKNSIFAGSTPCASGNFSLQISLLPGENTLIAKVKDALDQYGPDSTPVVVFLDGVTPVNPVQPSNAPPSQTQPAALIVTTDAIYRGAKANRPVKIAIGVEGGTAPYALSIDWQENERELISRSAAGSFEAEYVYKEPGTYEVKINAVDEAGNSAYVQTVVIVDGIAEPVIQATGFEGVVERNAFTVAAILLILLILIFYGGFLVGERRRERQESYEKWLLTHNKKIH